MKRAAYEQKYEKTENENVSNGEERRTMGMALYRSAICGIFTFYGVPDLLCIVREHE